MFVVVTSLKAGRRVCCHARGLLSIRCSGALRKSSTHTGPSTNSSLYIYPPTSPERRACETPPPSLEHPVPFHLPTLEARARRGHQSSKPMWAPGTQAAGIQGLSARMLTSKDLIILSSSIRDLLARNRPPQAAKPSGPRIHQISINRCSRPHRSAK